MQALQGTVRRMGVGPWTLVSAGRSGAGTARGALAVNELSELQGAAGAAAVATLAGHAGVVLVSGGLDGLEDIPPGVVAVLSRSEVDLLSYVALRARQSGALLATCSDTTQWAEFLADVSSLTGEDCVLASVDAEAGLISIEKAKVVKQAP